MTSIPTRDATPELAPLPMAGLLIAAWNLLDQASDLAQPTYITVSDTQSVDLLFPSEPTSFRAVARWGTRFGGVLASEPHDTEKGPQIWCRAEFDYYGVRVCAFAHIPAVTVT
jgi:hypothetical protein